MLHRCRMRSVFCHDEAVIATLPKFLTHLKKASASFGEHIDAGRWEAVAKIAHGVKGSAGSYGFPEVTEATKRLEEIAKGIQSRQQASKLLDSFRELIQRIDP